MNEQLVAKLRNDGVNAVEVLGSVYILPSNVSEEELREQIENW